MAKNLDRAFEKEIKNKAFSDGYDKGLADALKTILALLQHNDILLNPKEFWLEYKN